MVHLRMSGQLLLADARRRRPAHTHVVITSPRRDGGQLRFVDPRTFGEMFVFDPDDVADELPELAHLGLDPLETRSRWPICAGSCCAAAREAQAAADGPARHRRHRQHLQPTRSSTDAGLRYDRHGRLARPPGESPPAPARSSTCSRRRSRRRVDARRRAVRRPLRQAGRVPGRTTRCTAAPASAACTCGRGWIIARKVVGRSQHLLLPALPASDRASAGLAGLPGDAAPRITSGPPCS